MKRLVPACAALAVLASTSLASATVVVPVSVEEMSREAKAVVRAKVVAQQSAWDEAHRRIYTFTEVQVLERVHSAATVPDSLVIRTLGGVVGDVGMKVAGTSRFITGEEVVVFLSEDKLDAQHFVVMGMSQGKYSVDRSSGTAVAVPDAHGLGYARPKAGKIEVERGKQPGQLELQTLLAQVKLAATQPAPTAPVVPKAPGRIVPKPTTPSSGVTVPVEQP